jgi:hypothetical protein
VVQVDDLRAEAGRARDGTRRLQVQADRRSAPPADSPTTQTPARRTRPRAD